MTERRHRGRLVVCSLVILSALLGVASRLVYLHLGPNGDRRIRIEHSRAMEKNLTVGRGKIMDCHGNVLALDLARKELCADPSVIISNQQVQVMAAKLGEILSVDPAVLGSRFDNPGCRFLFLTGYGQSIEDEQVQAIKGMNVDGLFFNDVMVRSYPRGSSLCHVLGYVNTERVGSAGVEQRMDKYLRGIPGLLVSELDGRRRELYDRRTLEIQPRDGADIVLTIDQYVQYMVEQALDRALEETHSTAAWAVVQRVRTGEILAMVNRPSYDPNRFRHANPDHMRNRCVANVYEPGSTFKVSVIAAALNEKLVTPSQIFDCEGGTWIYQKRALHDFHPYGLLSVADIIKKSSNIGAAKVSLLLGNNRLYAYLKAFGFGRETGIELPGEECGILQPVSHWTSISATRIAIGHEVAVTALQMLNVVSTIANDGTMMKPYIVKRVTDTEGHVLFHQQPVILGQPISRETAGIMKQLLARVTEEGGTGHRAAIEGYSVGGKTGTAQKAVPGGYSDTLNVSSFVGFIPVDDPELAMIVVLDEPKVAVRTGGVVAAPVFKEVAEQAVRYLDIPPGIAPAIAHEGWEPGERGI